MSLSVCIISKNEEKNIERCLKSIQSIADEIIVVDTGSTDNTVEIAKKYNCKIVYHKWNNDFSKARNISLQNATKDWILYLDCDEELSSENKEHLKSMLLNNPQYEGFYVNIVNIINNINVSNLYQLRIFKNKSTYKFEGKIYEQISDSIQKHKSNLISNIDIKILHYGYDDSFCSQIEKANRNIDILLKYKNKDKSGHYFYLLGSEYDKLGNSEKSLESFKISIQNTEYTTNNTPIYYSHLASSLISLLYNNKEFEEELKYIKSFKNILPNFKDIYFIECLAYIQQCKLSLAKKSLLSFLNYNNENSLYKSSNFEKYYDVNSILKQLEEGSINTKYNEKQLSVVIVLTEENYLVIDTIKSINELAYEVIVVIPNDIKIDEQIIKNYGAKILKSTANSIDEHYCSAFKICICEYILILETKEIFPFSSQLNLFNFLNNLDEKSQAYFVYLADMNMQINSKSIRLFKNNTNLHNVEYVTDFVNKNTINDTDVIVCQNENRNDDIVLTNNIQSFCENDKHKKLNNTISVCIIAKNEEKNIGRCLESISHIADEIIVVDTGSTDNTAEIAKSYNAKIFYHEFENNFSKARNIALDNATMSWILQIDCDEELDYIDSYKLKKLLNSHKFEGHCLKLTNIIGEEKGVSLAALRVFKNKPQYRFEGRIHEQIQTSIKKYNKNDVVNVTNIKFYHYGYDSNNSNIENKIKRNISILLNTPDNEKDGFYYYNIGNEYSRMGNLEKALENYLNALSEDDHIGYSYHLVIYIIGTFNSLKRYEEGISYGEMLLKKYPTYKDLYFIISVCLYKNNNIDKCKLYLNKYIEFSKFDYGYPNFNFCQSSNINELFYIVKNYN